MVNKQIFLESFHKEEPNSLGVLYIKDHVGVGWEQNSAQLISNNSYV